MATSKVCACCGQDNFRTCACPWSLPFDQWPAIHKAKLADVLKAEGK